jgi:hypothetical protein
LNQNDVIDAMIAPALTNAKPQAVRLIDQSSRVADNDTFPERLESHLNSTQRLDSLLSALAQKLGIDPFATGEDGVSVLAFEGIDVLLTTDEQSMTLFARLGTALEGDTDLLEALLAANLFWQETGGATLSLEPYSRVVVIAQRLASSELASIEMLEAAIEAFARTAIEWTRTIGSLGASEGAAESGVVIEAALTHRA